MVANIHPAISPVPLRNNCSPSRYTSHTLNHAEITDDKRNDHGPRPPVSQEVAVISQYDIQTMVQINATMNTGGPACTLLTVQQLTGVKIPYLAMIDFKGVIAMSEAVGGVTVCVAEPIKDDYTQLYLEAGEHTLIGEQALAFLRTRHGVGDGSDLSRISNQQVFLTSLLRKIKSEGVLNNPIQLYSLANAAARNMQLSTSLTDVNVMIGIASALRSVDLDKMTFLQVPARGGLPAPYSGRVMPIYEQANVIFEKLAKEA